MKVEHTLLGRKKRSHNTKRRKDASRRAEARPDLNKNVQTAKKRLTQ
jgi:hypothetical protein